MCKCWLFSYAIVVLLSEKNFLDGTQIAPLARIFKGKWTQYSYAVQTATSTCTMKQTSTWGNMKHVQMVIFQLRIVPLPLKKFLNRKQITPIAIIFKEDM
jgi:hypothetical protein